MTCYSLFRPNRSVHSNLAYDWFLNHKKYNLALGLKQQTIHYSISLLINLYFAAAIVASFRLHKTVPELSGNKSQLILDIYEEVGIPNSTVGPPVPLIYTLLDICIKFP